MVANAVEVKSLPPVVHADPNPQKYYGKTTAVFKKTVATGISVIVPPSSNVNGIVVYAASAHSGTLSGYGVLANSVAPISYRDGITLAKAKYDTAGSWNYDSCVAMPLLVPAGVGLYHYGVDSNYGTFCIYEVL